MRSEKTVLKVGGMSCEHCVKTVTNTVKAFPGVSRVKVDLKNGTAEFKHNEQETPLSTIKAGITEAGYTVEGEL
jgi:copper chaperone